MAMSSYLINSNYVDPKFPPCEEYSQSDYLPSHSPDYYSSPRQEPASYQPDSLYHHLHHQHQQQHQPQHHQQHRGEPPFTPCHRTGQPASVVMSPRGHVLPPSAGLQQQQTTTTPVPEPRSHRCDSVTPSPPPPPSCGQTPHSQSTSSPASNRKDPVVYPWMKKVHVNIGTCCMQNFFFFFFLLSLSLSPTLSLPLSLSLLVAAAERRVHSASRCPASGSTASSRRLCCQWWSAALGSRFTTVCLQGQYNYTPHKFLLHLRAEVPSEVRSRRSSALIPPPYDNSARPHKLGFMPW